jgi:hypothetical protein
VEREERVVNGVPIDDGVNFLEESEAGRGRGAEGAVEMGEVALTMSPGFLASGLAHA